MTRQGSKAARHARTPPLRVWLADGAGAAGRMCLLREPFRLGFGEECDVRLGAPEDGEGPPILFQVERARGPLLIARAVAPEECARFVDLRVNGEPLRQPVQEIVPGTRLDIVDKGSGHEYHLVLDPGAATGIFRPRNLAIAMLVLSLAGAAFGGYLYWSLRGARTEINRTAERVERAHAESARIEERLRESAARMRYTASELAQAIDDLRQLQVATAGQIRAEFSDRIKAIDEATRAGIERLAVEDTEGRERIAARAREDVERMRGEFSERMVESYRRLKALEQSLLAAMAERLAQREPAGERFKAVFARASPAVLLVRTRYEAQFTRDGTRAELSSMGTGFVIAPSGLAVTAQHVLFPWRYEREFLLLEHLGLARVVPGSVRWDVWLSGAAALRDPDDPESFDDTTAFRSHGEGRSVHLLHAPEPQRAVEMISAPIGVVALPVPVPGRTDAAVIKLLGAGTALPHLEPPGAGAAAEPLDEVLVLGYPFSRLHGGKATPQAVRGFVRRAGTEMLELDAAVHPGTSGGVVLDRDGRLMGMVMAILSSELYGVALPGDGILALLADADAAVRAEEEHLAAGGCDPGAVDGVFDEHTRKARECEAARAPVDVPPPATPRSD